MSENSKKRRSSILRLNIRKVLMLFVLMYIIIGSFFYYLYTKIVIEEAEQQVTMILKSTNAVRTYVENIQKPVIYKLKKEGKLEEDFFDPKILSASYIARNIHKNYLKDNNQSYRYKLAATNPRNKNNKADSFEASILNQLRQRKIDSYSTILEENGEKYFFKAIPIGRNKASCMHCHSTPERAPKDLVNHYGKTAGFGEKIGDMRAMISLKIPLDKIKSAHYMELVGSLIVIFVIFLLFYLFVYVIYKKEEKIQEEKRKRESLLEEINTQLEEKVEKEIYRRLKNERELNEKERMLSHQSKLASMGEMIGNIAHQWRQPLTQLSTVLVNMELKHEMNKLTDEEMKNKVEEANRQIEFMSDTIDDFRNFFTPHKKKETYKVSMLIDKVVRLMGAVLQNNNIKLSIALENDFVLHGYPNEMAQALVNIIGNAKDIVLEREITDACICVKTFTHNRQSYITIEDNGGGVNRKVIDKIFDPYFSTKHASTGTGIGLYMTKIIIEKHNNGKVSVVNTENGALFSILFD